MAKRASGKYAYLIDDRSGRKIRYKDARTEWNGLRVYKKDWEPKHHQLTGLRPIKYLKLFFVFSIKLPSLSMILSKN